MLTMMNCRTGWRRRGSDTWSYRIACPPMTQSPAAEPATGDDFFTYCRDAFDFLHREGGCSPSACTCGSSGIRRAPAGCSSCWITWAEAADVWVTRRIDIARHWAATHPAHESNPCGEARGPGQCGAVVRPVRRDPPSPRRRPHHPADHQALRGLAVTCPLVRRHLD